VSVLPENASLLADIEGLLPGVADIQTPLMTQGWQNRASQKPIRIIPF